MAEAKVTVTLKPDEFRTVRHALEVAALAEREAAKTTTGKERWDHTAAESRCKALIEKF